MLRLENEWFIDQQGRKVLLRGVNLGGSSKVPLTPNCATHIKTDLTDYNVSFVGRLFPLSEAKTHFERIAHWGFNAIRFLVTWEGIEHDGPYQYDTEYLDYLEEILKIAAECKLYTFIDPHQDLWSRASGGDGAPIWTFENAGLDVTKFNESEAALLMQDRFNRKDPSAYPSMSWIQNYGRFATAHMFTLFFGGLDWAPSLQVEGKNIQDYLQQHYIQAIQQVARRVKDNPFVVGFETLNEPSPGWIGRRLDGSDSDISLQLYYAFTPFEAMVTSAGFPRVIPYRVIKRFAIREIRRDLLNPTGETCWLNGFDDFWRKQGVWGLDGTGNPVILNNEYFMKSDEQPVSFIDDYFAPFVKRYAQSIRKICPTTIIGVVPPPQILMSGTNFPGDLPINVVNASHWYDELTVGLKRFRGWISYDTRQKKLVLTSRNVEKMFTRQLSAIKTLSQQTPGSIPTVLGEFGLPFDMNKREGYRLWKNNSKKAWQKHIKALTMYYNAMDRNLLHTMLWNYTADNNNRWGDQWNQEDFSIFSKTQQINLDDIDSGGRAIEGFCRPHFIAVAGTPFKMEFLYKQKQFRFQFDSDLRIEAPSIVYVPRIHYPDGFIVEPSDLEIVDSYNPQLLIFRVREKGIISIVIKPQK